MSELDGALTLTPPALAREPAALAVRAQVVVLASLGLVVSGYNNFSVGLALIVVKPLYHLGALGSGLVAAATLAGMLLGALVLGRLADLVGRRTALLVDLAIVVVFALASAAVQNAPELVAARLLLGAGIGAGYPIGSSFVADVSAEGSRGRLMTAAFAGWGAGAALAALVGWLLFRGSPATSWRLLLALGAAPALLALALVATTGLPESPRWQQTQSLARLPFRALGAPAYRGLTLAALLPWFLMDVSVYGVGLFTPTLLLKLGFTGDARIALGTLLLAGFTLAGFALAGSLIDVVGRRPLQVAGFLGMAAALAAIGVLGRAAGAGVLLALFAGFQLASNAGPNVTTWIVPAEMFPTRLRATGQGAATAFSRIGAVLGVLLLPVLDASLGLRTTLLIVAGVSVAGAVATVRLLPETRGQPLGD